jgi:hypothetical protein
VVYLHVFISRHFRTTTTVYVIDAGAAARRKLPVANSDLTPVSLSDFMRSLCPFAWKDPTFIHHVPRYLFKMNKSFRRRPHVRWSLEGHFMPPLRT